MNVVPLRGDEQVPLHHGEADAQVVEQLEAMLADARSGHLRAFAYAVVDAERSTRTSWVGHCDQHDMTAAINILQFQFMTLRQESN